MQSDHNPPPAVAPPPGEFGGHPKGLYVLFTTELWERFNFYGMRAILVLYASAAVASGGLGWTDQNATLMYAVYTSLAYLFPLLGGYVADRYIGQRRSVTFGGLSMMTGQFILGSNAGNSVWQFVLGLVFIILGNGFFKPNISTMVGGLYGPKDARRDGAFTIFYMGINLGAFFAPLITGYLAEGEQFAPWGYRYGFLAAGIGMALGLVVYWLTAPRYLGAVGMAPAGRKAADAPLERVEAQANALADNLASGKLTRVERDRILVLFVMVFFATLFWFGFEQAGGSMNIYARDYIDRTIGSWEMPASWLQAVNALFIIIFAIPFSVLWVQLARRGREPRTPVKMGSGLVLLGIGFLFMVGASLSRGGDAAPLTVKASMAWIVLAYMFHTLGELCISPVGLSVFTKLAPARFASLMMGVWFLSNGLAYLLGGIFGSFLEVLGPLTIFGSIAAATIGLGLVMLALNGKLTRMMHGVH